jgi:lysophospholipase L1-like esterase
VNVYGFRRKKIMYQHGSPGITRVIVLGDSQTFGGGVKAEESFPYFAEEKLGKDWEVLNAGISGYRSLNIYRLLRLKMLAYDPDIIVVDVMPKDSPREDGPLVGKAIGEKGLGEWLWSSRVYYVSQLLLRITGLRPWETLPWPLQLHEIRNRFSSPEALAYSELGNEDLIARWADENGIKVIFMNYAYRNGQILFCHDSPGSKPEGYALLDTCALLKESGYRAEELFQDANHLTILGNKVVGEALAGFLGQVR